MIEIGIRQEILADLLGAANRCLEPVNDIVAFINSEYSGKVPDGSAPPPFASARIRLA